MENVGEFLLTTSLAEVWNNYRVFQNGGIKTETRQNLQSRYSIYPRMGDNDKFCFKQL